MASVSSRIFHRGVAPFTRHRYMQKRTSTASLRCHEKLLSHSSLSRDDSQVSRCQPPDQSSVVETPGVTSNEPPDFVEKWTKYFVIFGLGWTGYWIAQSKRDTEVVPITGRSRYTHTAARVSSSIKPEPEVSKSLEDAIKATSLSIEDPRYRRARAILHRLLRCAGLEPSRWWFVITKGSDVGASVSPSDRIVYMDEGYLNVARSDDELAFALAHEIGHVVTGHGQEWWDQLCLLFIATGPWIIWPVPLLRVASSGIAGWYYLRYARTREREADYVGLLLMAQAGYDPVAAIPVFEGFTTWFEQHIRSKTVRRVIELIDPHPKLAERIDNTHKDVPMARAIVNQVPSDTVTEEHRQRWAKFLAGRVRNGPFWYSYFWKPVD